MNPKPILVVDDEPIFLQSVTEYLLDKGDKYNVESARNGKEALAILEKKPVDLVILDINMPEMSGIQLLTELYNRSKWLPIIILTSLEIKKPEEKKIFGEFGIVEILGKPVNLDTLDQVVEAVLGRFQMHNNPALGVELYTILRMLQNEKRTGVITIDMQDQEGRIFFKRGETVDAEMGKLSADEALEACLSSADHEGRISIEYIEHKRVGKIDKSFTGALLDVYRLLEMNKKSAKEDNMARIKNALGSLAKEVTGLQTASIFGKDGIPIEIENPAKLDVDAFSAKFAMVSALVHKTVKDLSGGVVTEILIEEENGWTLVRPIGKTGLALFIAVNAEATLGNLRLVARQLASDLEKKL